MKVTDVKDVGCATFVHDKKREMYYYVFYSESGSFGQLLILTLGDEPYDIDFGMDSITVEPGDITSIEHMAKMLFENMCDQSRIEMPWKKLRQKRRTEKRCYQCRVRKS